MRKALSQKQTSLLDPCKSFWINASAGSGKTFVLVERILALLEKGVPPDRILMLTFTNTAAQEVGERVLARLKERAQDGALWNTLYQRFLERGGVQALTLHSFCHGLWQRFSVELGWGHACTLGSDQEQKEMLQHALEKAFRALPAGMRRVLVRQMSWDALQKTVQSIMHYENMYSVPVQDSQVLPKKFKLVDVWLTIPRSALKPFVDIQKTLKTQQAQRIVSVVRRILARMAFSEAICVDYIQLFVTQKGVFRHRICPQELGHLQDVLEQEAQRVVACLERMRAWSDGCLTKAVYTLVRQTESMHDQIKKTRRVADYNDMITQVRTLLFSTGKAADDSKSYIEQTVEHILVDEAQDTSMVQWDVLGALIRHCCLCHSHATVFIVGDYKQSIYGFQGVRLQVTQAIQQLLKKNVPGLEQVSLDVSYRCAPQIVNCVNAVSEMHSLEWQKHQSFRDDAQGLVLFEALEKRADPQEGAQDVARYIRQILESGVIVPSSKCAVRPEDILVLSKQRDRLYRALPEALAAQGIACCGVDRAHAHDYPLIAMTLLFLRVVLLPHDDVAVFQLLQSAWFGWDFDDIQRLLERREKQSLWETLCASQECRLAQDFMAQVQEGSLWLSEGLVECVHWFLQKNAQTVDTVFGGLGQDALMQFCADFEVQQGTGVADFLYWIETYNPVITNMVTEGAQGVRLLSVHGSKGLEAPVVVLIDSDRSLKEEARPWHIDNGSLHIASQGLLWTRAQFVHDDQCAEDKRLLYVAMTRARDMLCVLGRFKQERGTWYTLIKEALCEHDTLAHLPEYYKDNKAVWCPHSSSARVHTPVVAVCPRAPEEAVEQHTAEKDYGQLMHKLFTALIQGVAFDDCVESLGLHKTAEGVLHAQELAQAEDLRFLQSFAKRYLDYPLRICLEGWPIMGRPDYIGVHDKSVVVIDFKTGVVGHKWPQDVVAQMERYRLLAQHVFAGLRVRVGLFSLQSLQVHWMPENDS